MGYHLLRNEKTPLGWEWFVRSFSNDPHIPHPGQTGEPPFLRGKSAIGKAPEPRSTQLLCVSSPPTYRNTTFLCLQR